MHISFAAFLFLFALTACGERASTRGSDDSHTGESQNLNSIKASFVKESPSSSSAEKYEILYSFLTGNVAISKNTSLATKLVTASTAQQAAIKSAVNRLDLPALASLYNSNENAGQTDGIAMDLAFERKDGEGNILLKIANNQTLADPLTELFNFFFYSTKE